MEDLKDLTYLLNRYAVRDIDVITNPEKKKNKEDNRYWEFYVGLQKGKWKTEEEMAKHFGYSAKNDKGFRRLKEGLKERLLNSTLFIDPNSLDLSEYEKKCQESFRLSTIAELLYRRGGNDIYFEVANKALNLAIETENTFLVLHISGLLRGAYSLHPKYNKEYDIVSKKHSEYAEFYLWEINAQSDYTHLISLLNNKKGFKKEYAPIAEQMFEKYKQQIHQKSGYSFQIYARTIGLCAKILQHKWLDALNFCDETIDHLSVYKNKFNRHIILFNTQKASCLLMLGRYDESIKTLNENKNLIQEGKSFWFKNRELAAITSLYAEKYQQAWDLVQMALNHERYNTISEVDQETWRLYEGYLYLIAKVQNTSFWDKDNPAAAKFRINKWLNEMPLYSQDKRGGNIPLLMLQILFNVSELGENKKAYDEIANRAEALRKYNDRNLDAGEEHVRSDCFVGMLLLLPKFIYKPAELIKAVHPFLVKMEGLQTDIMDNSFEVEVVPYERQWGWVLDYVNALADKK